MHKQGTCYQALVIGLGSCYTRFWVHWIINHRPGPDPKQLCPTRTLKEP